MAQHERVAFFDDTWRAGLGGRFFPVPALLLELGAGFDLTQHTFADASDPWLAVEWRLPLHIEPWQVSVYVERQVSLIDMAGVRVAWGMGDGLRDPATRWGWRRVR